jgi:hypothetical protein
MRKITIQLVTIQGNGIYGYSFPDDNTVKIEFPKEYYDRFEREAKRFGMDILEALGHGVQSLIKGAEEQ